MNSDERKKILIVSAAFPYGFKEPFLGNEIEYLSRYFNICVSPILKSSAKDSVRPLPANVSYNPPFLPRNYFKRVIAGVFNTSPILPFLIDFLKLLKSKAAFKPKFILWVQRFLTARTILSSKLFKSGELASFDMVYFYWCDIPVKLLPKLNKSVFVRVHGGEVDLRRNGGFIPMLSSTIVRQDNIVYLPISNKAASDLSAINNVNYTINRLGVYDWGLNPDTPEDATVRIVSCSNLIALKRVHLIINALSLIHNIEIEWVHFGGGPLYDEIFNLSKHLTPNINVNMFGKAGQNEILDFYSKHKIDLFVNVSEHEGIPVSIMEAFSFGIPCFATNVGGTSEIVNNTNGFLTDKDFEIVKLARIIESFQNCDYDDLRLNARKTFERFCSAEKNYHDLSEIFKKEISVCS